MRIFSLLIVAAFLAAPGFARPPEDEKTNDPDKLICRTTDEIGTRLGHKRTCMTKSEWEQVRQQIHDTVRRVQDLKPYQAVDPHS